MSGPLRNTRRERFAQHLASGMAQLDAYETAGFTRNDGNASAMAAKPEVRARVEEIMAPTCTEAVKATNAMHRFVKAAWERIAIEVSRCEIAGAADLRALVEAALRTQQDQRVQAGGVSDRVASEVTTREDAAADEMTRMLDALAKRTRGDDDEATKH